MVPAQNVVPRSQLDTPQKKKLFLGSNLEPFQEKSVPGGPIGTFSGKVGSWGSNLEPVQEDINSWRSNLEPFQEKSVPGGPIWDLFRRNQFLEVQFGTFTGKKRFLTVQN